MKKPMNRQTRISFWLFGGVLLLVGLLKLGTPLLAALLSFFALQKMLLAGKKWVAITVFALLLLGTAYGLARFTAQAGKTLPAVADKAIPTIATYAARVDMELPFTDWESLKDYLMLEAKGQKAAVGRAARIASREVVLLLIGIVVAVSFFLNSKLDLDEGTHRIRNNLYSLTGQEVVLRFQVFYQCFTTVMGAQIIISAINTVLTAIFVTAVGLPHGIVVVGVTFLCGLLPVIGNILSNTIITAIAFTVSPKMALISLGFLIVIHKLEYFLNSKIIGDRIRNPVWLTLLGLILGEKLMGIPGMILAPVVLNYIKVEATQIELKGEPAAESP
jgi:predicted PurR-regulated permease PerM